MREINNLSPDKLKQLKKRYCKTDDKVKDLIDEFGLVGVRPSQLYLLFDDEITDEQCPYCNSLMRRKPIARSTISGCDLRCPICEHKKHKFKFELCNCFGCIEKRKYEVWKFFQTEYSIEYGCLNEIDILSRIFLGALILYGEKQNGDIFSIEEQRKKITFWDTDIENERFYWLYNERTLIVSKKNVVENFPFNHNNTFNLDDDNGKLLYQLWVDEEDANRLYNGDVLGQQNIAIVWKEINLLEAQSYLIEQLVSYNLFYYIDEKINKILQNYVEKFSLLEILSVIKYTVELHISDFRMYRRDKKEIAREILYHLENYYEWAKLNRKKIRKYLKHIEYNEITYMSKYFYEIVLKDKELFKVLPNDLNIT